MFNKLRNKFLWFNMGILTLVFLTMFTIIFTSTAINGRRQINIALATAMLTPNRRVSLRDPLYASSISVELNIKGDIINIRSPIEIDSETLSDTLYAIKSSENYKGTIVVDNNSFAYLKKAMPFGLKIVLVSRTPYNKMINNMIITFAIVGISGLGVLFLISWSFANKAIKPVKYAFEQQKRFVADASHELKTPLTIINTNLDLISSNGNETVNEQQKWIGYIYAQIDRMSKLINDMLTLARMDNCEYKVIFSKVDFSDLLSKALLYFEVALYEKNISLEQSICEKLYISGDKSSLEKLINILLENALKYTPSGGKVSVVLVYEKTKLILKIQNTYPGIPIENMDKIFDRFYRVNSARTQKNGGYGLGLAIAKTIVEQHNGKIWAESKHKDYAEFIIELPVV